MCAKRRTTSAAAQRAIDHPIAPQAAPPLEVTVAWRVRRDWRAVRFLERVARHVCAAERFETGSLEVGIVGAHRMRTLHAEFFDDPSVTDVITFNLLDPEERAASNGVRRGKRVASPRLIDGQVTVCADVALRRGTTIAGARRELALYVTHGILHLAGYDDHDPADFARMHAREDDLLAEIGLGRPFREQAIARGTKIGRRRLSAAH